MAKIRRNDKREMPALNTSSLPDIIFMLLFFFMSVTSMKEVSYKVQFQNPQATELTKLEKKSLVRYIYVGTPTAEFRKQYGAETRIQLDDAFAEKAEIGDYIINERSSMKESDQGLMTVSIKADKETKMGIIADIKQELRRAYALKISYAATQRTSLAASVCEARHDDYGPIWPISIAPWHVHLCSMRADNEEVKAMSQKIYDDLTARGVEE